MTKEKAIKIIQDLIKGAGLAGDESVIEALDMAQKELLENGCATCKHEDVEPWDTPCYDCRRNHKDYYTAK